MFAPEVRSPGAPPPHQRKPTLSDALFGTTTAAKRRSSLASVNAASRLGSASCKRKLSFSDTLQVHEIPCVRPAAADYEALRRAAEAAGTADGTAEVQVAAWREVAACMVDPALKQTYRACGVRKSLASVLQSSSAPPLVLEMAAAVVALAADTFGTGHDKMGTREGRQPDSSRGDVKSSAVAGDDKSDDDDDDDDEVGEERGLCEAVLSCICTSRASNHTISSLTNAIVRFSWPKRFPFLFNTSCGPVMRRILEVLRNKDDMDVYIWKSLMTTMAITQRAALESPTKVPGRGTGGGDLRAELLGGGGGLASTRVGVRAADVQTLVGALQQYADEGRDALPEAMQAFAWLCARSTEVAALFIELDTAAIVKRFAAGEKAAVLTAAVELLAVLAAPCVLSVASVL